MSLSTTVTFDTPANFVYDPTKIEISGGVARLVLQNDTRTLTEDFADDTGHTYDSAKAEFAGGQVQQKPVLETGETFRARYNAASMTADYAAGSGTGTPAGTPLPTVTGGKLALTGGNGTKQYVDYAGALNADSGAVGCIRFKLTPNYSGAPVGDTQFFISLGQSEGSANNAMAVHQDTVSGNIRIARTTSTGVSQTVILGAWSPTAGVQYEFELNWDVTTGATRLFIDGVQFGSTSTATYTRTTTGIMRVGNTAAIVGGATSFEANFSIDDIQVFNVVKHTTNYTPGTIAPLYQESAVQLPAFSHAGFGQILELIDFETSESGSVRWTLSMDGVTWYYWDGAAWSVSDESYAQAATTADTNANVDTFEDSVAPPDPWSNLYVQLHFTAGATPSSVSNLDIDYNAEVEYLTTGPKIYPNSAVDADALVSWVESVSKSGSDDIRWTVRVNAVEYWWSGTAWAIADGTLAQTNTETEINTNAGTLDISSGAAIRPVAWIVSDDGTTTPSVTSVTFTYSFFVTDPGSPSECIVYGWLTDLEGNAISGATVRWFHSGFVHGPYTVIERDRITTTDASGYWELSVIETASISLSPYSVEIKTPLLHERMKFTGLSVPNVESQSFDVIAA